MQQRSSKSVVKELQRRARKGCSLKSGDNRGDWLYASALKYCGSWRAAVEAAGFDYEEVAWRPLTPEKVIARIRELVDANDPLVAADHKGLVAPALRHFGSWKAAVEAAGCTIPDRRKWTPEKVIETIRSEMDQGFSMGGGNVNTRNPNLYAAARRRFGSWDAAVEAATEMHGTKKRRRRASTKG